MKLTDKDKSDDKGGSRSGYGAEITTLKIKWTVSQVEALRFEAIERGRTVEYYGRIALSRMLEKLQQSREDITESDINRRNAKINLERKFDSLGYIDTVDDAIRTVDDGINKLDRCIRIKELNNVAKIQYDSMKEFVCYFEDDVIRKILLDKFNVYIDNAIRPSKRLCKIIGMDTDRDCRGRFIKGNKANNNSKKKKSEYKNLGVG